MLPNWSLQECAEIVLSDRTVSFQHHSYAQNHYPFLDRPMKKVLSFKKLVYSILFVLMLAGCESIVSSEDPAPHQTNNPNDRKNSKFRFSHLFEIEDDNGSANGMLSGDTTQPESANFIIGFTDITLDPYKLLQRYSSIDQFKLLQRYDGSIQFTYGMGVRIVNGDSTGTLSDFLASLFGDWQSDQDIAWFEPDIDMIAQPPGSDEPDTTFQVIPWNIANVGYTTSDVSNVSLYVIDSEVRADDINLVEVKYFTEDSLVVQNDYHGYNIAGTAGAADNSLGVIGVAPGVPIHSFVVTDANGEIQLSNVVQALDEVVSRKNATPSNPMVVNLSLGTDVQTSAYNALDEAVDAATEAGVVVVIAAGNESKNAATISPAHTTSAITVGAYDINDSFAWFSNYGPVIDILAPGVNVVTIGLDQNDQLDLVRMDGTSLAAPHVAGAAIVYLAGNPTASPEAVRSALIDNARNDIGGAPTGTTNKAVVLDGD